MDQSSHYRTLIKQAITEHATLPSFPPPQYRLAAAFDDQHQEYLLRKIGWTDTEERIWHALLHVSIYNGKIWIEEDWTEDGIATYFLEHGISPQELVLGFQPPEMREYTEFAAA